MAKNGALSAKIKALNSSAVADSSNPCTRFIPKIVLLYSEICLSPYVCKNVEVRNILYRHKIVFCKFLVYSCNVSITHNFVTFLLHCNPSNIFQLTQHFSFLEFCYRCKFHLSGSSQLGRANIWPRLVRFLFLF